MQELDKAAADRAADLRDLMDLEIADIVATANEQGFSAQEALGALGEALSVALGSLGEDPEPTDDPETLPAGPHSTQEQVDTEKTPGGGMLPDSRATEIDPGAG